jgi:hypothetical protein
VENKRSSTSPSWVAHDTDEPQEGDAGKRHKLEAQPDESTPLRIGTQRLQAVGREGNSQHRQRHQQQHPKDNPRDRRRPPASPESGG